jgi:hypothetical protein
MNIVSRPIRNTLVGLTLCLAAVGCGSSGGGGNSKLEKFSFFVTSIEAMTELSPGNMGFGGDLSYGETGAGAGLRGADKICKAVAEMGMAGAGAKNWHAFLSTSSVNAKDRIGTGPWFDAREMQVASNLTQLLMERPGDADVQIKNDLPNEFGIPNKMGNNHAVLTGTDAAGVLFAGTSAADVTCNDWTSKEPTGAPRCGHAWPRTGSGLNWMSSISLDGCAPCQGTGTKCVGATGGYGAIYCFATK